MKRTTAALLAVFGCLFVWAYTDVIYRLALRWWEVPDYSHGFFVVPLAGFLAYSRRSTLPATHPSWYGLGLVLLGLAMRLAGLVFTIEPVEQSSLLVTLAGLCWCFGGWKFLRWSIPILGFLVFMIPLPYSLAVARAAQLQRITAVCSSYLLQTLGIPAFTEGNVIRTVSGPLDVAYACSGLQMMVAFLAVTYLLAALSRYPISGQIAIFVSAVPIAMICNILRITATGIAYQYFDGDSVRQLFHDFGGFVLVPVAIGLVFVEVFLFERSFPKRSSL